LEAIKEQSFNEVNARTLEPDADCRRTARVSKCQLQGRCGKPSAPDYNAIETTGEAHRRSLNEAAQKLLRSSKERPQEQILQLAALTLRA
jgi:hypothetical protein